MGFPHYRFQAAALVAILLIGSLAACQTGSLTRRSFSPERRIPLQTGGPQSGSVETVDLVFEYQYTITDDQQSGRAMQIDGGLKRFKIQPYFLTLNVHFLDAQGLTLQQKLLYAINNRQLRDSYVRPTATFTKTLEVPDQTVYIAFSSYARQSKGRR